MKQLARGEGMPESVKISAILLVSGIILVRLGCNIISHKCGKQNSWLDQLDVLGGKISKFAFLLVKKPLSIFTLDEGSTRMF